MWPEHRGGYAFRLCKVPEGGIAFVTEKCFQEGHLNFYGDSTWIYWQPNDDFNPNNWMEQPAVRTRVGTTPAGSQWSKVNLPTEKQQGDRWAFKDLVQVPEALEPGKYVF